MIIVFINKNVYSRKLRRMQYIDTAHPKPFQSNCTNRERKLAAERSGEGERPGDIGFEDQSCPSSRLCQRQFIYNTDKSMDYADGVELGNRVLEEKGGRECRDYQ